MNACCAKTAATPRRQLYLYVLTAAWLVIACRSNHVPGTPNRGVRDGGGVGCISSTCVDVAEESVVMATRATAAENACRARGGGEEGGGEGGRKMGGTLPRVEHQSRGSPDIASGSSFMGASSSKTSGGAPSAQVRLLDIVWSMERVGHYLLGHAPYLPMTRDCRPQCSIRGLRA